MTRLPSQQSVGACGIRLCIPGIARSRAVSQHAGLAAGLYIPLYSARFRLALSVGMCGIAVSRRIAVPRPALILTFIIWCMTIERMTLYPLSFFFFDVFAIGRYSLVLPLAAS